MKRFALVLLLSVAGVAAQTKISPDCQISFSFTAAGQIQQFNNLNNGYQCMFWTVSYSSTGFSALSLVVQTAPDSSGSPGSWSTFSAAAGSNPNTAITHAASQFGTSSSYFPWLRVDLASVTGSGLITGTFYGYRTSASGGGGGGGGGCTSPCEVVGPDAAGATPTQNPVAVAGLNNAGKIQPFNACVAGGTLTATYSTSSSGATQLVAASSGKTITVCYYDATPASSVSVHLVQGTGTNCGTSTASLDGLHTGVLAMVLDPPGGFTAITGNAVCLNLSSGVQTSGTITYAQF